jgi:hypothetical protein
MNKNVDSNEHRTPIQFLNVSTKGGKQIQIQHKIN